MKHEDWYLQHIKKEALEKREKFDALSPEKQKREVNKDQGESKKIKDRVNFYVSPDQIIPDLKTDGMFRTSEVFRNKSVKDIGQRTKGEVGEDFDTSFVSAHSWLLGDIKENKGRKHNQIKKFFEDIPIVDLGAGNNQRGYFLARILGASGYVATEPNNWPVLEGELTNQYTSGRGFSHYTGPISPEIEKFKKIPFAIAPEDALTFLKRLPDHSVGVFSFGVDSYVLGDVFPGDMAKEKLEKIEKYCEDVNNEISRVLHPSSAVITENSAFEGSGLEEEFVSFVKKERKGFYIHKPKKRE